MSIELERAKPLLGTVVAVRVSARDEARGHAAIDAAFRAVTRVHAAMSAQSEDSDLAAIARARAGELVPLAEDTRACLKIALDVANLSGGGFDPVLPDKGAGWRDLTLTERGVRVARPLRLDLSGVAKGFAVDRAVEVLRAHGIAAGVVNAGGDLAVFGSGEETVALTPRAPAPPAAIRLADGALASSDVQDARARHGSDRHYDGRTGAPASPAFVAVAASACTLADALTKVVLALGEAAEPLLRARGATAWRHTPAEGWRTFGEAP